MGERRNIIETGDRIFARLSMGGRTIVEFMMNTIGSRRELLNEIRKFAEGMRGLAKLYIRNQSRGWSEEGRIMMYNAESLGSGTTIMRGGLMGEKIVRQDPGMMFPWETH